MALDDIVEGILEQVNGLYAYRARYHMPIPLLADEEIEGDEEENEIDPRMQNPQANHSHYERHRDDNPEDDKWYDEEDIGHLHEEPLQ